MTAAEARQISDLQAAKRDVQTYISRIKEAAEAGQYQTTLGPLSHGEAQSFRMLGYKLETQGANVIVRWGI